MSKIITASHHITEPGKMTIISVMGSVNLYSDQVELSSEFRPGVVYDLELTDRGISLREQNGITLPEKVYDFEKPFRDQILRSLRDKKANMNIGVLLEGYKGQGKSVIAKQLAIESGLPIICINQKIPSGYDFISFLGKIKQDHVLLIDEFEKLFSERDDSEGKYHTQDVFLSFLDGTISYNHKRLTILTSNKEIGDKFINRPSRIRYYKKFNFMSNEIFNAIVNDKLKNKRFKKDLIDNLNIPTCTIDILTTIIEEINIHNKAYSSFKKFFNHKEKSIIYTRYKKSKDGRYEYFDEVIAKREIGVENENSQEVLGYNSRVISNDGETIYYELKEWEGEDEKGKEVKNHYKAVKQSLLMEKKPSIL